MFILTNDCGKIYVHNHIRYVVELSSTRYHPGSNVLYTLQSLQDSVGSTAVYLTAISYINYLLYFPFFHIRGSLLRRECPYKGQERRAAPKTRFVYRRVVL